MSWHNAPTSNKLTAAPHAGPNLGAHLRGVDVKGKLYTTYQQTPGGQWGDWMGPEWNPANHPPRVYELAAWPLGDGRVQL